MTLADFTTPGLIIANLTGKDAAAVIQELCVALQHEGYLPDLLPFYQAALNREFLASTELEEGIALPHARLAGVSALTFAFGRSAEPIRWGTRGGAVSLVFLLAVPATDVAGHLQLISGLAKLAKEAELRDALRKAETPAAILAIFEKIRVNGQNRPERAPAPGRVDVNFRR